MLKKLSDPQFFPFCSPPFPVINDHSNWLFCIKKEIILTLHTQDNYFSNFHHVQRLFSFHTYVAQEGK